MQIACNIYRIVTPEREVRPTEPQEPIEKGKKWYAPDIYNRNYQEVVVSDTRSIASDCKFPLALSIDPAGNFFVYRLTGDLRAEQHTVIFMRARPMNVPREPVNRKTLGPALD